MGAWLHSIAFLFAAAGMAGSVFHLGRPRHAWRAFLGLRTSWLSREIVSLGAYSAVLSLSVVAAFIGVGRVIVAADVAAALTGTLAVLCSAMVYSTRARGRRGRHGERRRNSSSTVAVAACVTGLVVAAADASTRWIVARAAFAVTVAIAAKIVIELACSHRRLSAKPRWNATASLMLGPLRGVLQGRIVFGLFAASLAWVAVAFGSGDCRDRLGGNGCTARVYRRNVGALLVLHHDGVATHAGGEGLDERHAGFSFERRCLSPGVESAAQ